MTLLILNDVFCDVKSTQKIDIYVIIVSFKSEPTCKLKKRISGWRLLISSLPGSALRKHV